MISMTTASSFMDMAVVYLVAAIGVFAVMIVKRYDLAPVAFMLLGIAAMFEMMSFAIVAYA
jgi:hypothetical protein